MQDTLRYRTCVLICGIALTAAGGSAQTADYPNKPVRFVVGYPAGGTSDIIARLLGQKLGGLWGQSVTVENRAGAGGNIAAEYIAKSPGDGYTLLLGNNGILANNTALYDNLPYDPVRDFTPVILVASQPNILVVHPALPVRSLKQLIALTKSRPGQLNYASAGGGAVAHLAAELFKSMAKVDIVHIPYKGAQPALTAIIGGQTEMMFATSSTVVEHIGAGRLRGLAVTSAKRLDKLPELPTMNEAGVPGFEAASWHGVVVSSRTPPALVSGLNADFAKVLKMPDLRDRFSALATETLGGTSQDFVAYMRQEIPKWAKLIKEAKVRGQ